MSKKYDWSEELQNEIVEYLNDSVSDHFGELCWAGLLLDKIKTEKCRQELRVNLRKVKDG